MKLRAYQKLLLAFLSVLAFLPMISVALCEYPPGTGGGGP